ncbi:hypothetical protein PF006_g3479 [Phytophthora fragariae]|uniref:Uncharacterized protein n=1 Tax=Phytophthora fragariae TaxID=53985 RepID=A0A6A3UNZ5_9STRA|nr:hypothetical protein PF003_g4717 [Phytophthora fragariae]KAE9152308.1 hypothetical protein PF006_g3479 [Phytophthora fragariae]
MPLAQVDIRIALHDTTHPPERVNAGIGVVHRIVWLCVDLRIIQQLLVVTLLVRCRQLHVYVGLSSFHCTPMNFWMSSMRASGFSSSNACLHRSL